MSDLVDDVRAPRRQPLRRDNVRALCTAAVTAEVEEFVRSRAVIEQARGILIQMLAIDGERAFAVLLHYSQHHHVEVRVLAEMVVDLATHDQTPPKGGPREQMLSALDELVRAAAETARPIV